MLIDYTGIVAGLLAEEVAREARLQAEQDEGTLDAQGGDDLIAVGGAVEALREVGKRLHEAEEAFVEDMADKYRAVVWKRLRPRSNS